MPDHGKINISITGGQASFGNVVQGDRNVVQAKIEANASLAGRAVAASPFVFISHVSEDKLRIAPHLEVLMEAGVPLWVDRPAEFGFRPGIEVANRISTGEDWRRALDRALDQSAVILVFWSHHSVEGRRDEFMREVRRGIERGNLMQVCIDTATADGRSLVSRLNGLTAADQVVDLARLGAAGQYRAQMSYLIDDLRRRL